ncbi:MAG: biosynthetic arginine decarboxylase, partial [Gloeomargaritaceae cyanobacterium C42_A2020_066]|nr:biosynthetic arginine decarboxylase [Gloeomargaritaceae cyanobacterium C42_A2020_066]
TAILSRRLGHNTVIVIEQVEEAEVILAVSRELGIRPAVGVRAKLSTKGVGRWGTSAGDRAKFGLTVPEMLGVVETLQAGEALDCLRLLHFHIGSQISSISVIKEALREAGHIYAELKALGAAMGYLDVGGGLAVDYDGSKTNFYASKNYSMQNYTNDVVAAVKDICTVRGIPVPTIVSESGRAIAAHQSVLVFNVLGVGERQVPTPQRPAEDAPLVLRNLYETWESLSPDNYQEIYHDAHQFKDEAISLFNLGYLTLAQRGTVEQLYWACCQRLLEITQSREYIPDDLEDLPKSLAALYYVNLSVFQSVPDNWAIDQLFPIMPLHRLDEEPASRATLADLTCDSDGKIDQFIDLKDVKPFLELHRLNPGEPYYLGLFLGGAYQEIMGNLHNLFGDTNTVHIRLTPGTYRIEHVVRGDTMREVLGYVQYDPEDLLENMRRQTEQALQDKHITLAEAQKLLQNYEDSLNRYTYLTD